MTNHYILCANCARKSTMNINKQTVMTMIITALVIIGTLGMSSAAPYDESLILENKDSNWDAITDDSITATVQYSTVGEEFAWKVTGAAVADTEYVLIYYADKSDRFTNWGGDNPGALIGTFTTDSTGAFGVDAYGYTELNMCLPSPNDANIDEYDYTDEYGIAHGAKLWIVPSSDYTEPALTAWNPTTYLFETALITYTDCGDYPGAEEIDTATFSIDDIFNYDVASVPIMVINATNAGAVDITLAYNTDVLTVTGVSNGDMDVMFKNMDTEAGTVRIGTYQIDSSGMTGDFTLANVSFTKVGEGTCDFVITVTTFKDATPCGMTMPSDTSIGICCPCKNGDVNDDDIVDMFDAMYLARYSIGATGFDVICECAADVDGTAPIDINDAAYLARYIIGMDGYEELR